MPKIQKLFVLKIIIMKSLFVMWLSDLADKRIALLVQNPAFLIGENKQDLIN